MASPESLGDFFAKKNTKKKVKAVNLNKEPTTTAAEAAGAKPKRRGEDAEWQEEDETVNAEHAIIGVAGKLENEEKTEEGGATAAWGNVKVASLDKTQERRYPTLQRSMMHPSNIDNTDQVAISVAKNHFSALGGDGDDGDDNAKKSVSQVKVGKKKGEFITAKDTGVAKKKTSKKKGKEDSEDESEDEEGEAPQAKSVKAEETTSSKSPDLLIMEDLEAAKAKYDGRRKLPSKEISAFDRKDKENRSVTKSGKKAINLNFEEELGSKKLQYVDA